MQSIQMLAAQAHCKAALLNLLACTTQDGNYMTAVVCQVSIEDGEGYGSYQIGGLTKDDDFKPFQGGSL